MTLMLDQRLRIVSSHAMSSLVYLLFADSVGWHEGEDNCYTIGNQNIDENVNLLQDEECIRKERYGGTDGLGR